LDAGGGRGDVLADAALTPAALRAAVDAILLDEPRWREMAPPRRGSRGPTRRADVARAVLEAAQRR
jgi:hypothetical protein